MARRRDGGGVGGATSPPPWRWKGAGGETASPIWGFSFFIAATESAGVMGVVAMGARSRFIAPVMDLNRRRVCCARAARESSTSAVVIVGGAVAGLLRGRLSASSVDVSPLRKSVSRRFTAARKDSPARGGART